MFWLKALIPLQESWIVKWPYGRGKRERGRLIHSSFECCFMNISDLTARAKGTIHILRQHFAWLCGFRKRPHDHLCWRSVLYLCWHSGWVSPKNVLTYYMYGWSPAPRWTKPKPLPSIRIAICRLLLTCWKNNRELKWRFLFEIRMQIFR